MNASIDSAEYEYLWSNNNINFIFNSNYLSPIFRAADIVLIYEPAKRELKYFLGKKDRERIEDWALDIYQNRFEEWRTKISGHIETARELIRGSENRSIAEFSNERLWKAIAERKAIFQELVDDYFCTEFFAVSKAEAVAHTEKELAERLDEMSHVKYTAREVLTQFYNYRIVFKPFLDVVAARFRRDDIEWLDIDEVLALLNGKQVPVSVRGVENWVRARFTNWELLYGEQAEKIRSAFNGHFFSVSSGLIKGIVANKGRHTGPARVLKTVFGDEVNVEIAKVQKGDVLIAATTGPELMIACRIAGAIVTDEGGLTSHAAIVSRELRIPCVVGTKIATKTFKDGDMVEVDAEKGVVRKL